jgi:antitoxin HicB
MPHYIGLILKDRGSCCGLSFPDVPGVFTAGDSMDETMRQAVGVLEFAAEDWQNPDGPDHFLYRVQSTSCARTPNFRKKPLTL